MTEHEWQVAFSLHVKDGFSFTRLERMYGKGHGRIKEGFEKRGWLDGAFYDKSQRSPARTSSNWHPHQEVVAQFLAQRKRSPEFIASVVNRPVAEVEKFVRSAA